MVIFNQIVNGIPRKETVTLDRLIQLFKRTLEEKELTLTLSRDGEIRYSFK